MTNFTIFSLGKRIAHLRKTKKMSQLDLSVASGVAKTYLCELEGGKRNPSVLVLERIALALGVTLSDLFEGVGPLSENHGQRTN